MAKNMCPRMNSHTLGVGRVLTQPATPEKWHRSGIAWRSKPTDRHRCYIYDRHREQRVFQNRTAGWRA
ncbi:hypothetical protein MRX96_032649 [Rhipicephalus microplus]